MPIIPNVSEHIARAERVAATMQTTSERLQSVAQQLETTGTATVRGRPDWIAANPGSRADTVNQANRPYFQGVSQGAPPPSNVAEAARVTVDAPQQAERVQRVRNQLAGATQTRDLVREAITSGTYQRSEFRALAESQADTLYHLLTQSLGETQGLAAMQRSRQIHEQTGSLGLLSQYSAHHDPEALSTIHTRELERLAPALQSDSPSDADITAFNRLLGSDNERLQRTPHEFGYDLVARLRNSENATAPLATPLAPHDPIQEHRHMRVDEHFSRPFGDLHSMIHETVLPAMQFVYESAAASARNTALALERGDTESLRDGLSRASRFLERVRRPIETRIAHQDTQSNIFEQLMRQTPAERNATLARIESESAQARDVQARLRQAMSGLPPEALARIANQPR